MGLTKQVTKFDIWETMVEAKCEVSLFKKRFHLFLIYIDLKPIFTIFQHICKESFNQVISFGQSSLHESR